CILGHLDGWAGTATIGYSWPDAEAKARRAAELIERLCERAGLRPTERVVEIVGVDSLHGGASHPDPDVNEVILRVCCRFETEAEAAAFPRLAVPLALNGPPFIGGGLPPQPARRLVGVWPAVVPRDAIEPFVEVVVEPVSAWLA
ncbi:MAG TPA: DUF1446 domain-containing protein, partial [Candidatus Dormibacteraeota bacterium]|nr:DUF1446 domain-containing protein [Candidatus Dormibacteraeota bacterium]